MIAILEGSDKCGKTTLAKEFQAIGYKYIHFGAPKPGGPTALEEMSHFLSSTDLQGSISEGQRWILDRFHIGEMVYPAIFGRDPSMDMVSFRQIEEELDLLGSFLIHCTDEVPRIAARFKQLNDEPKDLFFKIGEVVKTFNEIVRATKLPGSTYRIGDNMKMLVHAVDEYHSLYQHVARQQARINLGGSHDD